MVQQHHDAVAVGVAVEMSGNDVTVLPADGDQPLVVASSYRSGVSDKGQVPHRDMSYDVHLDQEVSHIKRYEYSIHDNILTVRRVKGSGRFISDLLLALSSFLQSLLQPLVLSCRVGHVTRHFIRAVVEDGVETDHPQTRLHPLGVETTCRMRKKNKTMMII